jgi:hypothetical protein
LTFDAILVGMETRLPYLSNYIWHTPFNLLKQEITIHLKLSFDIASKLQEKLTLSYFN